MIRIDRTTVTKPTVLTANETQWRNDYLTACAAHDAAADDTSKNAAEKEKKTTEKKYNHKTIKDALETLFHGKCAYCESFIGAVHYGEIEHFRPKASFPALCFEWENLLLGCSICNNVAHKSTQFPVDSLGQPLLINPCDEEPNDFLGFKYDPSTSIANVFAINDNEKGNTTITIFGLNTRIALLKKRSKYVKKVVMHAIAAIQGDYNALETIQEEINAESEYTAFARAIWQQLNLDSIP